MDSNKNKKIFSLNLDELNITEPIRFNYDRQSFDLEEKDLPEGDILSINIELIDILSLEQKIKDKQKKFEFNLDTIFNACHGTQAKNVESILNNGWKVGGGNVYGSGVYFGLINKKKKQIKTPIVGQSYNSETLADSYARNEGALILSQVDWGNKLDWNKQEIRNEFNKNKIKGFSHGDLITEWALQNNYDSLQSGEIGVMLQHQFKNTKKYWNTNKIRIKAIYYTKTKKVELIN